MFLFSISKKLGENMNISSNSNYIPQFGTLYVDKTGMGDTASVIAESLSRQIQYSDSIDKLDKMGVDTIILKDPKNTEDRAIIAFIDPRNRLYKVGNQDHIKTGKSYDLGSRNMVYDENTDAVLKAAEDIASGRLTKKTTKMTQTLAAILNAFPIRSKNLDIDFIV